VYEYTATGKRNIGRPRKRRNKPMPLKTEKTKINDLHFIADIGNLWKETSVIQNFKEI
jgi:hypothetical protein